jgi:hypothetical protein
MYVLLKRKRKKEKERKRETGTGTSFDPAINVSRDVSRVELWRVQEPRDASRMSGSRAIGVIGTRDRNVSGGTRLGIRDTLLASKTANCLKSSASAQ